MALLHVHVFIFVDQKPESIPPTSAGAKLEGDKGWAGGRSKAHGP